MRKIFGVLLLFYIITSSVYAYSQLFALKTVTQNNTVIVDFTKSPSAKKLFDTGQLSFDVLEKDVATVVKKNNSLLLHFYDFTYTGTITLVATVGDTTKKTPLSVSIEKSDLRFNIRDDMLYLSLQKKKLSCESSAAADIASHLLKKHVDEDLLISLLPWSIKTEAKKIGKDTIWGNPEEGFVGYIDTVKGEQASQKKMTGYGVYERPVAKALSELGLKTTVINARTHSREFTPKQHLTYLLGSLKKGYLVELWGDWCTRPGFEDAIVTKDALTLEQAKKYIGAKNECYDVEKPRTLSWKFVHQTGKLVEHTGLAGEHTFILLGWEGKMSDPTHIFVWDTDTGYHRYDIQEWMRKWEKMNYRSLIVETK